MRDRNNKNSIYKIAMGIIISLIILIGIPLSFLEYQSIKTGKSWKQIIEKFMIASDEAGNFTEVPRGDKIDFLIPQHIGDKSGKYPQISNLQAVDLDEDGLLDVVVCDVLENILDSAISQRCFYGEDLLG